MSGPPKIPCSDINIFRLLSFEQCLECELFNSVILREKKKKRESKFSTDEREGLNFSGESPVLFVGMRARFFWNIKMKIKIAYTHRVKEKKRDLVGKTIFQLSGRTNTPTNRIFKFLEELPRYFYPSLKISVYF